VKRYFADASGATAIEYGLIVAMIFLAIIGGITAFADGTNGMYEYINETITGVL